MRYLPQNMLGFAPSGCLQAGRQLRPPCVPWGLEPHLSGVRTLVWLQLSGEHSSQQGDWTAATSACSGCSGRAGAEWVPSSGRGSPLFVVCSPGCLSQARRLQSRPDPVPSSRVAAALTAFPPRTMNLPVGVGAACSFFCACLP